MPTLIPTLENPMVTAERAVSALHDEVDLTPKPGLVDRRSSGAHTDMNRDMLHTSAEALRPALAECAYAAQEFTLGAELRARIGVIGRSGERAMLRATGGVNTHRGALWALGLLSAAAGTGTSTVADTVAFAARLASLPDPGRDGACGATLSHGEQVRRRFHVAGAPGEARAGFPHIIRYALPALRRDQDLAGDPTPARLDALLSLITHLDDTCLLHRGGIRGLTAVQSAAVAVLDAGGMRTVEGRQRFSELDRLCAQRRLSPGGAGDLLSATLFLDTMDRRRATACKP